MHRVIEQICRLPEDDPVFEFRFTLSLEEGGAPHLLVIRCLANQGDPRKEKERDEKIIVLERRAVRHDLDFASGWKLKGTLQVVEWGNRREPSIGVEADIEYWYYTPGSLKKFSGLMFLSEAGHGKKPCPPPPPWPPDPDCPPDYPIDPCDGGGAGRDAEDADADAVTITAAGDELFPYVYIRSWPALAEADKRFAFFGYAAASPPAGGFVAALKAARGGAEPRAAMEALARSYIQGDPPYAGQFVRSATLLPGPLARFPAAARALHAPAAVDAEWLDRLCARTGRLLARDDKTPVWLSSAAYAGELDRVWESYFALVVLLGYDPALLAELGEILWLANAIRLGLTTVAPAPAPAPAKPPAPPPAQASAGTHGGAHAHAGRGTQAALRPAALTERDVDALAHASPLLPAGIFPLPPGPASASALPPADDGSWAEPYAVGDLQKVRQRLIRYDAGEIARIENVMRGERREVASRHGRRDVEHSERGTAEERLLESENADARSSLAEETNRTIAGRTETEGFSDFSVTYGPPTQGTVSGTRTLKTVHDGPGSDDVTRFARDIVATTVSRISRKVGTVRASSSMSDAEERSVSIVDNSAGAADLCAVYRWVNKVYKAQVVNYGNRLMMEFLLPQPGARLAAARTERRREQEDSPLPPAANGIRSFADIDPAKYAAQCATYGVTDITPPPAPSKYATGVLRGGDEIEIAIPPGYSPKTARTCFVCTPPGLPPPAIIVGCQAVPPGDPVTLTPGGEVPSLTAAAGAVEPSLSPPSDPDILITVEICCEPAEGTTDQWKIDIYGRICAAYQQGRERRADAVTDGTAQLLLPAAALRDLEYEALRQGCTRMLLDRAKRLGSGLDGSASSPPSAPLAVAELRYLRFVAHALEWRQIDYSFVHADPVGNGTGETRVGSDTGFERFLAAAAARILLPVRPHQSAAFLYFLSSGMIWEGPDWLVAVNEADAAVADDLKRAGRSCFKERAVGRPWEVVVPTTMQILQRTRTLTAALQACLPAEDI